MLLALSDDPNTWMEAPHECRIYGDDRAQTWCVVDYEDYQWALQWKWHINEPHKNRNGTKRYFRRSQSNGRRYMPPIYLHVEILKRAKKRKRTRLHHMADHKDGDEFNCRRDNLRWATVGMNNRNR